MTLKSNDTVPDDLILTDDQMAIARKHFKKEFLSILQSSMLAPFQVTTKRIIIFSGIGAVIGAAISLSSSGDIQETLIGSLIGSIALPLYFAVCGSAMTMIGRTIGLSNRQSELENKSSDLQDTLEEDFFNI